MKKKNGFIAISLIYSFFLVFLMLMVSILGKSMNNRILVGSIKDDIRDDINNQIGFVVKVLEPKTYQVGELVSYANESWRVMQNKTGSVVLILNRALTQVEIGDGIGRSSNDTEYYGACNGTSCRVRMCRSAASGVEYCHLYPSNTLLYRIPTWNPSESQITSQLYSRTIPSGVVHTWFRNQQWLQNSIEKNKLLNMSFSDGNFNLTDYVRLPSSGEIATASSWGGPYPFHLIDKQNNTQTKIYNGSSVQIVNSYTDAYVRPVIEVVKG